MVAVLMSAIIFLAPHTPVTTARKIAVELSNKRTTQGIDPLLLTSIMFRESTFRPTAYSKQNYGLLQVRVTDTLRNEWSGKEHKLLSIRTNIRVGAKILKYFKNAHTKHCGGNDHHQWWAHHQWGHRVRGRGSSSRVSVIYDKLRRRYGARLRSNNKS